MTSLLRMSEQDLAEQEQRFAFWPAVGVAAASSVLSLGGMMLRYQPGDAVPISGMDAITGQIRLALGLGVSMVLAAYLVRSVIMKRLQWAVLFSLLVHLIICVALRTVTVDVPITPFAVVEAEVLSQEEMTLPDYGGAETPTTELQEWERPTDVDVPEAEREQQEREQQQPDFDAAPQQVEIQRQVDNAVVPEQQQRHEQMRDSIEVEMQMQTQRVETESPDQVEAPEVQTSEARESVLNARAMQRNQSQLEDAQREMASVQSNVKPSVSASDIAARTEIRPDEMRELQAVEQNRRATAEAEVADTSAEVVEQATTAAVSNVPLDAPSMQTQRQSQSSLNDRRRSENSAASSAASSASMRVSRISPSRSAASSSGAVAAPSGGGAVAIQRSATASGSPSSPGGSTSAESVQVTSAAGVESASFSARSATGSGRSSSALPDGAAGGGNGPAVQSGRSGVAALQAGTIGRGRGSGSGSETGPRLGASSASQFSGGSGPRGNADGSAGAVGTQAAAVRVSGVGGSSGAAEGVLANGPRGSGARDGRSGSALPAGQNLGSGSSEQISGSRSGERTVAMNAAGRSGLSGRGTETGARLRGSIAGERSLPSGRSAIGSVGISMPSGSLQAEQSGSLVITGPQEQSSTGGGTGSGIRMAGAGDLAGPRSTGSGRRSAGLPGAGRGPGSMTRRSAGLPGNLTAANIARRSSGGGSRPRLSSPKEIAGLIRRNVPGISDIQTDRISAAFSMRTPEARREAVESLGGSEQSEAAVERGLEWLVAHQYAAGNWSIHNINCTDHDCQGNGSYQADPAATGLALLALLGAGNTHQTGNYSGEVRRGIDWLVRHQKSDGDLFPAPTEFAKYYGHGIATIALCEAYGMTKDEKLREPAQKAVEFIADSQHPEFGGWRYRPQFESDTSVSGWQLMAIKSAEMAGLDVPRTTYAGVSTWLDSVEDKNAPGRFRYHPTKDVTDPMTAEGLLMRQYLGADRSDSALQAGASYLQQRLPRPDARNVYYWYYATQVMFHMQGSHWQDWNEALRDLLVETQEKGGSVRGSWDPVSPVKDTWGKSGGRHYVTCMNLLMLEVYYRHLPLYIELAP